MTNATDFRKYSYQYDTAYMLRGFDVSRSSAAPKRKVEEQEEKKTSLKLHENERIKSAKQIKTEMAVSKKRIIALVLVATMFIGFVGLTLYSFALKNELTREISSTKVNIANAQSENISLQSELDSMVSIGMIDDYAVNKLHMTKMKSNQIQYMDVNQYKQDYMKKVNQGKTHTSKQLSNK